MKKCAIIIFLVLICCSSYNKNKSIENNITYIDFSTFLDEEVATIYLNDSLYCDRKILKMNQSLGIVTNYNIETKLDKFNLIMSFEGFLYKDLDSTLPARIIKSRKSIDTSKGNNIIIRVLDDKIEVIQQKQILILD